MTEIFITNIQNKIEGDNILNLIKTQNPGLKVNFDFDETKKHFLVDIQFYELKATRSIREIF